MPRLKGRFDPATGRPLIAGLVAVLDRRTALDVVFLVDSGADVSILSPVDALALGLDSLVNGDAVDVSGVTGRSAYRRQQVTLAFQASRHLYLYRVFVLVASASQGFAELPSILGRDVLNRWDMSYRPTKDRLSFDVVNYDGRIGIK